MVRLAKDSLKPQRGVCYAACCGCLEKLSGVAQAPLPVVAEEPCVAAKYGYEKRPVTGYCRT